MAKISRGFQEVDKIKGDETVVELVPADFCLIYYSSAGKLIPIKALPCPDHTLGGYDLKGHQPDACLNVWGTVSSGAKQRNSLQVAKVELCK